MKKTLLLLLAGIGIFSASAQNTAEYKPLEQFNGDVAEYTAYNYCKYNFKPINRRLGDFLEECEIDFDIYRYENSILKLNAEYGSGDDLVSVWFNIKLGNYTKIRDKYFYDLDIDRNLFKKYDIKELKDLLDMNIGVYYVDIEFVVTLDYDIKI